MNQNHKELMAKGQIKIFNGSIFSYNQKTSDHCFVLGFEILDNMPHDRLYAHDHPSVPKAETEPKTQFTHQSRVNVEYNEDNEEQLSESIEPITDDKLI